MRTTLLLNQHKKCECIIEMIIKCDKYLSIAESSLNTYLSTPSNVRWQKYIFADEESFRNVVDKYTGIKSRLENYYKANIEKIIPVIELT